MKRLLLISVTAGAGHKRAADALEKQVHIDYPDIVVEHIDFTDYISFPTKAAFFDSYELMVRNAPTIWGLLYKSTDNEYNRKLLDISTSIFHTFETKKFIQKIKDFKPDHIVSTHFTPSDTIDRCSDDEIKRIPQSLVLTDYWPHELWVTGENHTYFVATKETKDKLHEKGIPKKNIHVSGIPIDPIFYEKKSKKQLLKKYNIPTNVPCILVLSGGGGSIAIDTIIHKIFTMQSPVAVIAIAGNNKRLKKRLEDTQTPKHVTYKSIGWTDRIDEYMRMADLVITKPGGITTSECVALGKPMLLISPIPGQEEANALYIEKNNYGRIMQSDKGLLELIGLLLTKTYTTKKRIATKTILSSILKQ